MKLEEALVELRNGKKIRPIYGFEEDEYLMGCYVTFRYLKREILESFEEMKKRGMSIVKMKGEYKHPDMVPFRYNSGEEVCKHGLFPQINLYLLMQDWEIYEGEHNET